MSNFIIKVLIVDDSLVFREKIRQEISKDKTIEVVGTAEDPFDARDKILQFNPDVVILDVEMPKMNGIDFLRKLMPQYPIPVVVVSSQSKNVFESIQAGAVDFVSKPYFGDQHDIGRFFSELMIKIKIASIAKVGQFKKVIKEPAKQVHMGSLSNDKVIAIGASTGGTEAIFQIVKSLPKESPGIVIVQHMPPIFTKMYAQRLNQACELEVKEAESGDRVSKGQVLIAPGDYHMKLRTKRSEGYTVECFKGEKINGHCPSVDVLFYSVAQIARENAIGIILTGMGKDGACGLLEMKNQGAHTIGQDEQSSVVYGMPKVAYEIGAVERQASTEQIPQLIHSICSKSV